MYCECGGTVIVQCIRRSRAGIVVVVVVVVVDGVGGATTTGMMILIIPTLCLCHGTKALI